MLGKPRIQGDPVPSRLNKKKTEDPTNKNLYIIFMTAKLWAV